MEGLGKRAMVGARFGFGVFFGGKTLNPGVCVTVTVCWREREVKEMVVKGVLDCRRRLY